MRNLVRIFLLLPALTILGQLSSALGFSELLGRLVGHWRLFFRGIADDLLRFVPGLADIAIPSVVLDTLAMSAILTGTTATALFFRVQEMVESDPPAGQQKQVSSTFFWLSVLLFAFVFYFEHDLRFFEEVAFWQTPVEESGRARFAALLAASAIWFTVAFILWLREDMLPQTGHVFGIPKRLMPLVYIWCFVALLAYPPVSEAFRHAKGVVEILIYAVSFVWLGSIILFLSRIDRSAVAVMLVFATSVWAADQLLKLSPPLVEYLASRIPPLSSAE